MTSGHLRHRHMHYKMTCIEFDELLARSGDRCEICGVESTATGLGHLVIDHDHKLGIWAVRGLLCSRCNTSIGVSPAFTGEPRVRAYLASPYRGEELIAQFGPPRRRQMRQAARGRLRPALRQLVEAGFHRESVAARWGITVDELQELIGP